MTCRCLVRQRARIAPKKTCTAFVLPIRDLKGFLRFLRKTTNTLETLVNAGFAFVLGKFEYDCLGGRNLRVWFESYLRSHSFGAAESSMSPDTPSMTRRPTRRRYTSYHCHRRSDTGASDNFLSAHRGSGSSLWTSLRSRHGIRCSRRAAVTSCRCGRRSRFACD